MESYITKFLMKKKKILLGITIFFIMNIMSSIPLPYLSKIIIDDIIIPKNYEMLYKVLLLFLFIIQETTKKLKMELKEENEFKLFNNQLLCIRGS